MTYEEFLKLTEKLGADREPLKTIFSGIFSGEKSGNQRGLKK